MESTVREIRHAVRRLAKSPAFTAVVLITLALGIGANTAIYTALSSILLRPLPYDDPGSLVYVWESNVKLGVPTFTVSPPNFQDWRESNEVFDEMTMVGRRPYIRTDSERPERVEVRRVSANFFAMVGVPMLHGRAFLPGEDAPEGPPVAVLNEAYWQRQFGGDAAVLDRQITLDGTQYTIVGVANDALRTDVDLWLPLPFDIATMDRGLRRVEVWARLKSGVDAEAAQRNMDVIAANLADAYPEDNEGWGVKVVPMLQEVVQDFGSTLNLLLLSVGLILLIAMANVANLFLTRLTARRRELSIQLALGAGRWRLLRQTLAESLLLTLAGGALGLLVAQGGSRALVALYGDTMPRGHQVALDGDVLLFALGLSLAVALVLALFATLATRRGRLVEDLKDTGAAGMQGGRGGDRVRQGIVVLEVALALVLLVGAGLMTVSLQKLQRVEPGFRTENILAVDLFLPGWRYNNPNAITGLYQEMLERMTQLPGAEGAATISPLPLSGQDRVLGFTVVGRPTTGASQTPSAHLRQVSPSYRETMKVPLLQGRFLSDQDTGDVPKSVVINRTMADSQWPGEDSLGQKIAFGNPDNPASHYTVVGVVEDVRHASLGGAPGMEAYLSFRQSSPRRTVTLLVPAGLDPRTLADGVRDTLFAIDPEVPITALGTLDDHVRRSLAAPRTDTTLVLLFAGLALLLAAIGLYGVLSHLVVQRRSELGIRMALGAHRASILRLVLGRALRLIALGLILGCLAAQALPRVLADLLYETPVFNPWVYLITLLIILGVALLAVLLPALRATRVDPAVVVKA